MAPGRLAAPPEVYPRCAQVLTLAGSPVPETRHQSASHGHQNMSGQRRNSLLQHQKASLKHFCIQATALRSLKPGDIGDGGHWVVRGGGLTVEGTT